MWPIYSSLSLQEHILLFCSVYKVQDGDEPNGPAHRHGLESWNKIYAMVFD